MSAIPETDIRDLDWNIVPSPCFVVDTRLLERNARIFARVRQEAGCKILAALKGFAMWSVFPVLKPHLDGCCASGPVEAQLAREEFNKEVHTYAVAYSDADMAETIPLSDHIVFNSPAQLARFLPQIRASGRHIDVGLRVNPEYSEVEVELYNPCAVGSRLGTRRNQLGADLPEGVSGLHFHVMCEQGADVLERVLAHVEDRFGDLLPKLKWINFGGGHHITKPGYDVDGLVALIKDFRARHPHLTVYLEPGEAVGLNTGVLVASVLDVVENGLPVAILDVSATAHMPDTLEMPYRPTIHGAGEAGATKHTYRLGGPTCLAGDVAGDWSFAKPLKAGDRVVFADMAHYTMVKTTMFNGVKHPSIATWDGKNLRVVRRFGYADYRNRLS
ncbi:MAG: carboxynorspermidine decarboxylase [Planctomycetota bacterium]